MMRDSVNNVRTDIKNYKGNVYIPDLRYYATIDLEQLTGPVSFEVLHGNLVKQNANPLLTVPR